MKELISRFDSLSPEEKAVCPYVATDALIYIQSLADISGRQMVGVSKKLITAMRKAKKAGAPDDRWRMERLVDAYAVAIPSDSALAEKMLKDAKLWDDPLFGALADFTIVNSIIESYGLESGAIFLELMSDEVVFEIVSRCSSALEVMESRDDVRDFSWRMVYLYAVRGIVSRNKDDMKLATDYLRFFLTLGQIDGPLAVNLAILISRPRTTDYRLWRTPGGFWGCDAWGPKDPEHPECRGMPTIVGGLLTRRWIRRARVQGDRTSRYIRESSIHPKAQLPSGSRTPASVWHALP